MTLKAKLSLVVATLATALLLPATAMAQTNPYVVCENGGGGSSVCGAGGADPIAGENGAIVSVTSILAVIAGIVSVIFLVYGGIKYITSGGDSSGVSSAKSTIIAALIGLVIAALARPIITFVIGKL